MEPDPGDVVTVRFIPLLTFNNFTQITKYALNRGSPTFIWHRATPYFVGWLAGRTWKNNNNWYILLPKLLCNFVVYTQFTNLGANRIRHTASGPRVGDQRPKSSHYFINLLAPEFYF